MKKTIAWAILLGATSANLFSAAPSSAQTVPIISGTLNTVNANPGYITSLTSSTFLTPLGTVSINSNGFNGTLTNTIPPIVALSSSATVTSSVLGTTTPANPAGAGMFVLWANNVNFFVFTGTTNGISPNGAFTNAATTINADLPTVVGAQPNYALRITGGSITLPPPPPPPPPPPVVTPPPVTCTGCLIVTPTLLISNNVLQGSPVNYSDYKYPKEDFSKPSFQSRILYMEDK